jgi:RNA polymerase sigma-70 factor (ECF subfamily)
MKSKMNINFNDEELLVRELKKFNENAFNFFVLKYQGMITSYVNKLINNKDESWNISQEVFISVFRNINTFRGESSLKTWLFRIARNYTINKLKYLKVRKSDKHNSIDNLKEKYPNYDIPMNKTPLKNLENKEELMLLELALMNLNEKDREIIVLRDLNELNYDEISEILGISLGTVKSRLFRARDKLKISYDFVSESKNGQ